MKNTQHAIFIYSALYLYRVSTLKVEHRQLTLCIQFIDVMPLFRYINKNKNLLHSLGLVCKSEGHDDQFNRPGPMA
jgi:hypothetical protein